MEKEKFDFLLESFVKDSLICAHVIIKKNDRYGHPMLLLFKRFVPFYASLRDVFLTIRARAANVSGKSLTSERVNVGKTNFSGVSNHGILSFPLTTYSIAHSNHKVNSFQMLNLGKILSTCQIVSEISFDNLSIFCYTEFRLKKEG